MRAALGSVTTRSRTRNARATLKRTLPNGTYYWRVRAITKAGAVSAWTKPQRSLEDFPPELAERRIKKMGATFRSRAGYECSEIHGFHPGRAGFDLIALRMASRGTLAELAARCDRLAIEHSPVQDRGPLRRPHDRRYAPGPTADPRVILRGLSVRAHACRQDPTGFQRSTPFPGGCVSESPN